MQVLTIHKKGTDGHTAIQAWHARSLWQRLRGLIARPALKPGQGLLISPCNSVHTFGMRYPLDLVFLDKHGKVVKCVSALKVNRLTMARRARHALELPCGSILASGIVVGDRLGWSVIPNTTITETQHANSGARG